MALGRPAQFFSWIVAVCICLAVFVNLYAWQERQKVEQKIAMAKHAVLADMAERITVLEGERDMLIPWIEEVVEASAGRCKWRMEHSPDSGVIRDRVAVWCPRCPTCEVVWTANGEQP